MVYRALPLQIAFKSRYIEGEPTTTRNASQNHQRSQVRICFDFVIVSELHVRMISFFFYYENDVQNKTLELISHINNEYLETEIQLKFTLCTLIPWRHLYAKPYARYVFRNKACLSISLSRNYGAHKCVVRLFKFWTFICVNFFWLEERLRFTSVILESDFLQMTHYCPSTHIQRKPWLLAENFFTQEFSFVLAIDKLN